MHLQPPLHPNHQNMLGYHAAWNGPKVLWTRLWIFGTSKPQLTAVFSQSPKRESPPGFVFSTSLSSVKIHEALVGDRG